LLCWLLIASERWHGRFSHDHTDSGPQKFHEAAVPRIGGLALGAALALEVLALDLFSLISAEAAAGFALLALSAVPAFAGGIAEDLTKKVGPLARLLLTMAAGALAAVLVHASLDRLDIPGVDALLQSWPLIGIAFTAFAVAGVANSVNIIDGYNGLAGAFAVVALIAFAAVAAQLGDQIVLIASLSMLGAVTGFLIWNWPGGRIFMGDGGAYLLGFWLAELGVLLVVRNPSVSPWFPLLLLAYPVWETLFSVYRRAWRTRQSPGQPDAQHLHHLVYQSLLVANGRDDAASRARSHRATMPRLMLLIVPVAAIAVWWSENTGALIACTAIFAVIYTMLYRRLERQAALRNDMVSRPAA
jgi:UDP-N-acetylmuramyl pentapeptide phosphotransferase/UDP-N-acetylglucosamine-1-phosphate transferase